MAILAELFSDDVLDTAYDWLCKRRQNYPADADVWSFRRQWPVEKVRLKTELAAGRYRFSLLTRITLVDGEDVDLWSARDALVLKTLTIVLAKHLPVSPRCTHVKGHGGAKAAVRQVWAAISTSGAGKKPTFQIFIRKSIHRISGVGVKRKSIRASAMSER